jgi:hypothetical protein
MSEASQRGADIGLNDEIGPHDALGANSSAPETVGLL